MNFGRHNSLHDSREERREKEDEGRLLIESAVKKLKRGAAK